jgi:hypothetical protein
MSCHGQPPAPTFVRALLQLHIASILALSLLAAAGCDGSTTPPGVTSGVFVADVTGGIHQVDLSDGALTFVADSGIPDLYALAFDATTNKVFGGTGLSQTCQGCVYSLDSANWEPTGIDTSGTESAFWDMTVSPADGVVYAVTEGQECGTDLRIIDKVTGNWTDSGLFCESNYGLTHSGDGTLYVAIASEGAYLGIVIDGVLDSSVPFSLSGPFAENMNYVYEMAPHPTLDGFVGITDQNELAVIDRCTALATYLTTAEPTISAIVTIHPEPLPAAPDCN